MPRFTVDHLVTKQLDEAWPLVRMAGAHVEPSWWRTEAEEVVSRGGGVLAARAADGSIHGIATYEPDACGLAVERLLTFELNRNAPCRQALCAALEILARARDCENVALPWSKQAYEASA